MAVSSGSRIAMRNAADGSPHAIFMCVARVGDHRVALRLAAGAGGGRNADHRQQRRGRLAVAAVVGDLAAVGEQEVDALGAVERAAAAERRRCESIALCRRRSARRRATMALSGFSREVGEADDRRSRRLRASAATAAAWPGRHDARIGDEQRRRRNPSSRASDAGPLRRVPPEDRPAYAAGNRTGPS